jgi:hypothetical protein
VHIFYLQIVALFNQILLFKQKKDVTIDITHVQFQPLTMLKPFLCVKIKAEIPSVISSDKVVGCDQHDIYLFSFFSGTKKIFRLILFYEQIQTIERVVGFRIC